MNSIAISSEISLRRRIGIVSLFALGCLLLVLGKSMSTPMNPDENVFLASASLWGDSGLLPYRDFHYNHLPTLMLIYGLMFKVTDHLLLATRLFSVACAAGLVTIIFALAMKRFERVGMKRPAMWAMLVAALLMCNSLFTLTTGLAWNHDFPALMTLVALLVLDAGLKRQKPALLLVLSGILAGVAITSRLTFAPSGAAYLFLILSDRSISWRKALGRAGIWLVGLTIACLPTLWIVMQSPYNALWGNILYPRFNTAFHAARGAWRITIPEKIWFFISSIVQLPGNGALTVAFIVAMVPVLKRVRRKEERSDADRLQLAVAMMVALLLAGSFAASPIFKQYMYAAMPLMVLGLVWSFRQTDSAQQVAVRQRWLVGVAIVSCAFGMHHYLSSAPALLRPSAWTPMRLDNKAFAIHKAVGNRPVLTLAPAVALEGDMQVYPELATGLYGFRVSDMLTAAQRRDLKIAGNAELDSLISSSKPPAILLGGGPDFETDVIRAAIRNHYSRRRVQAGLVLLVPPDSPTLAQSAAGTVVP